MSPATNPQKIAMEFEASGGLAIIFGIIVMAGCVLRTDLITPALSSLIIGSVIAGAAVSLVRAHRYREALWIFRGKVGVAVAGGLFLFTFYKNLYGAGAFSFGLYAGFWVSVLVLRHFVAEQLTFIRIGADLDNPKIQDIFR